MLCADFFDRHAEKIVAVSESGCWIWTGAVKGFGYGMVYTGRKSAAGNKMPDLAHRVAFEAAHGPIPREMQVCHRCDVPACVNPDHLFLGTANDNVQDKIRKGRGAVGKAHGMAMLSEPDVQAIRSMYQPRVVTAKCLAKRFGVSPKTIQAIIERRIWRNVE